MSLLVACLYLEPGWGSYLAEFMNKSYKCSRYREQYLLSNAAVGELFLQYKSFCLAVKSETVKIRIKRFYNEHLLNTKIIGNMHKFVWTFLNFKFNNNYINFYISINDLMRNTTILLGNADIISYKLSASLNCTLVAFHMCQKM